MNAVKRLLKIHRKLEKLEKFKDWCDKRIDVLSKEREQLILAIPDYELLAYGELVGYVGGKHEIKKTGRKG